VTPSQIIKSIPLGFHISTQERNSGPPEEPFWITHRTDKCLFKQYRVDDRDLEMWCILDLTRGENCPFRTSESMHPKSIVLYLRRKGWTAREIHNDLVATLGEEVITYSTVTKYLREARINSADVTSFLHATSLHLTSMNQTKLSCKPLKNSHSLLFSSTARPSHTSTSHRGL
jgi:hypothetical protein